MSRIIPTVKGRTHVRSSQRAIASGAALLLVGVLSACSTEQPVDEGGTQATGDSTTQDATTQTPSNTSEEEVSDAHNGADTMFAQMMIVHHKGALEMAELAVTRADTAQVRSLAEEILAAQGPEIETMTSWLSAWEEPEMATGEAGHMDHGGMQMDGMSQQEAMAELEGLSGAEFDTRFLELMIAHHQGAVQMAEEVLAEGQNTQAAALAQQIIEAQEAEISQMQDMLEKS